MFLHDCDPPDSTVRVTAVFWSATAFDWAGYCISTIQVNAAFFVFVFSGLYVYQSPQKLLPGPCILLCGLMQNFLLFMFPTLMI